MKHFLNLLSVIAITCSFVSCSNEDNIWKYGDKQELEGTYWESINNTYGGIPPTNILQFNSEEFTLTLTYWTFDTEGKKEKAEETITNGKYEYKHPNLKLIFEDGNEVEAWISARNTIGFYKPNGAFYEYARENSAD